MRYKLNQKIIIQKLGKKQVIAFNGDSAVLYTFNEIASLIFQMLKKQKNPKEIIDYICTQYQVEKNKVKEDFRIITKDFLKKRILLPSPNPLKKSKL